MSNAGAQLTDLRFAQALESSVAIEATHRISGHNLRIANVAHPPMYHADIPPVVDHNLVFHYRGTVPVRRFYGETESGVSHRLRTVTVLPAHHGTRWLCEATCEVLHFYLDDAVLRRYVSDTLDLDPDRVEILDNMGATDKFMAQLAPLAMQHLRSPTSVTPLMVDGFEQMLAAHLIGTYSNRPEIRPRPTGKLDPDTLERVYAHMADSLEDSISLADLAALTPMSVFEFARAFKQATGTTPHQALLERRVARVQDLLQNSGYSLAEIAYACGFSSQAHMTTTFAKHVGVTPGRYRKEVRG